MGTQTVYGTKSVLAHLHAQTTSLKNLARRAIVTDLREEAVVYICGKPFVLGELDQPVDTLKYVGIEGPVVEHMEARLKDDILTEAVRYGGRVLLHREEHNPVTKQSDIIGFWESISPADVKTPAEVYDALRDAGYNIDYKRIPLTRERVASTADVDAIQSQLVDDEGAQYLFISHTGFGGIAYAMAITCLRLKAQVWLESEGSSSLGTIKSTSSRSPGHVLMTGPMDDENAFKQGDYRDILSLTRVLAYGPTSKAEVDMIIDK
eukprot:Gb_39661 [translate_table: standard]